MYLSWLNIIYVSIYLPTCLPTRPSIHIYNYITFTHRWYRSTWNRSSDLSSQLSAPATGYREVRIRKRGEKRRKREKKDKQRGERYDDWGLEAWRLGALTCDSRDSCDSHDFIKSVWQILTGPESPHRRAPAAPSDMEQRSLSPPTPRPRQINNCKHGTRTQKVSLARTVVHGHWKGGHDGHDKVDLTCHKQLAAWTCSGFHRITEPHLQGRLWHWR